MTIAGPKIEISDDILRLLADDAFAVLNWAKRLGLQRERQIDETVKAFKKRLQTGPDVADPAQAAVRLD